MNRIGKYSLVSVTALFVALMGLVGNASAQTTNWIAYNDHRAGPTIPPHVPTQASWGTHARTTRYDMGAPGDTLAAVLTNFLNGQALGATITVVRSGAPDDFGTVTGPGTNTPSGRTFLGKADLSNAGIVGVDADYPTGASIDYVTIRFNGLNPDKRYNFRGTSGRGGNYSLRWSVAQILAEDAIDAHQNGPGSPGVLTSNQYPASLNAGQAAWNSGDNVEGDVVGWDFIDPYADGSFSLVVSQYVGQTPVGMATDVSYGYSFGAILLAEIEATAPVIVTHPAAQTAVEQNRPFSLSVGATGSPLLYQWYKKGLPTDTAISGATFATYSVEQAAVSDSGDYYVVVYNPLSRQTSSVAQVTVTPDITAPAAETVFSYPNFDMMTQVATLDQVIVDFNEVIQADTADDPSQYTISTVGNPAAVTVTGPRTVLLTLPSALAEGTQYTLQLSGIRDLAGNTMGASSVPFESWVASPGNGMLFEAYNTATGVELTILKNSPNYPNNPYYRTNIWAFDSRVAYSDDTHELYGARISGVFIPPVSGTWLFYFRVYDRGEVYLNPNGLDPAGKELILVESTGNEPRNWNKFISSPFNLRAGKGYYMEALYQAGSAGAAADVIKVSARLLGTGVPTPVDTPNTMVDSNSMMGAYVAAPLAPRDFGGVLSIVQQPASATVEDQNLATFSVQVNNPSRLPVAYQWYRDNVAIPGAFGPTYSFYVSPADDQAKFKVEAAKIGAFLTSSEATLTVVPDTTPPRALSATSSSANTSNIVVRFSERIQQGPAQDPFNYGFPAATILSATLEADAQTVTIVLESALTPGQSYTLEVTAIPDLAGHILEPSPTFLTFVAAGDLPKLEIVRDDIYVGIYWPAPSTGFALEQSPSIDPGTWTPVPDTPVVVNGRNCVSLTIESGNRIFRLRRP